MPKRKKGRIIGMGEVPSDMEYKGHGPQSGMGFADDFNNFLKQSHLVSNLGNVALPALGGLVGSFASPGIGTALGAAAGSAGNEWIKSQGYGKYSKIRGEGYNGGVPIPINRGSSKFDPRWVGKVQGGGRKVKMRGSGIGLETSFGTVSNNRGTIKL